MGSTTDPTAVVDPQLRSVLLPPANGVWGKVIFSQACVNNSVHRGDLLPGEGGACSRGCLLLGGYLLFCLVGGCLLQGVPGPGGAWWRPPGTATAVGGTHPTRMHSCYANVLLVTNKRLK